jgi:hypothetical protein
VGGGLFLNAGTVTINGSTVSGNSAGILGGGILTFGTLNLTNAIVAGNSAASSPNIYGAFDGANNLIDTTPFLAPLGNYGGPTQTMPPLHGSPAIDAGLDSVTNFLVTDQRGYPRLSGAHVDIGAVEAQWAPAGNPPLLSSPARASDGTFSFSFTTVSNADFSVLSSTNVALPSGQWSVLGPALQSAPGHYQFSDPAATNYPQRFYRVVSP